MPGLRKAVFAVPGDLSAPTGGYEYARRVLELLPDLALLPLPDGFPTPDGAALHHTAERLGAVSSDTILMIDGLAFGALPSWCLERITAPIVALVHHPLCLETGLTSEQCQALRNSERAALARARQVITTSASTACTLAEDFAVPAEILHVAEPGTDPGVRAMPSKGAPHLLAVGAISPRKGYDLLIDALAGLADRLWHLTIAGDLSRNPAAVQALRAAIATHGLTARVTLPGAVPDDALRALYARADLFIAAALHEGYGMAASTAMAHGLPLVATTGGALAQTIPPACAVTCAPGSAPALRAALAQMLDDPTLRTRCAEASWAHGQTLPRWAQTAARIAAVLNSAA